MRILVHPGNSLALSELHDPAMRIEAHGDAHFSAIEMFVASVGLCVVSALSSYADQIGVGDAGASVEMSWEYEQGPFRISRISTSVDWPGLPANRREAAIRAAETCTLHHTFENRPELGVELKPREGRRGAA